MLRLYAIVVAIALMVGLLMPASLNPTKGRTDSPPVRLTASSESHFADADLNQPIDGPWTTLHRQANGHFFARAQVNGQGVDFLVDTGATAVSLTEADARRIGIALDPSSYTVVGSGASGPVYGQFVTLDSIALDGKRVDSVPGAVLKDSDVSLLGQSFLSRMGHIEIAGDRMVIR